MHQDTSRFQVVSRGKSDVICPKTFFSRARKLTSFLLKENKEVKFTAAIAFCFLPLQNYRKSQQNFVRRREFLGLLQKHVICLPLNQGLGEITNQLTHKPTKAIIRRDLLCKRGNDINLLRTSASIYVASITI